MLLDDSADHPETTACEWQISDREYAEWQAEIRRVTLPLDVLSCITAIRHGLTSVEMQDSDLRRNVYVSDRRWKNIVKLLKTSAFVHGRTEVSMTDLLPSTTVYGVSLMRALPSVTSLSVPYSCPTQNRLRYRLLAEIRFESQPCARSPRQSPPCRRP